MICDSDNNNTISTKQLAWCNSWKFKLGNIVIMKKVLILSDYLNICSICSCYICLNNIQSTLRKFSEKQGEELLTWYPRAPDTC